MTRGTQTLRVNAIAGGNSRLRSALAVTLLGSALAITSAASTALAGTTALAASTDDLPPYTWSITMLDGAAPTSRDPFGGMLFVPGEPLSTAYIINHTPDINGALELSAKPRTEPQAVESELWVTVGVDGVTGESVRLSDLLRRGETALATTALPEGPVRLDIAIELEADSVNYSALEMVRFGFAVTVSDREIGVPTTPTPNPINPGDGDGDGTGDDGGDGDGTGTNQGGTAPNGTSPGRAQGTGASGLSNTGPAFVGVLLAAASGSIALGLALSGRRRKPTNDAAD
jgi:hypothetical protein